MSKKRKLPRARGRWSRLGMENLESRRVLATLLDLNLGTPTPGSFTYTDSTNDIITIRLEGTAGNASITQDGNNNVTSIAITNASPNFALSFSVDSTTNVGDGIVFMGDITSGRTIRGLFTVADLNAGTSLFSLSSYRGVSFSAGGGISVNQITGDAGGVGLVLASLPAGTAINTRTNAAIGGNLFGDVTINGAFGGAINVGRTAGVAGDVWTIGGATGAGTIITAAAIDANAIVRSTFQGGINSSGNITGSLDFLAGVGRQARIQAVDVPDMNVFGGFNGRLFVDDLDLSVSGTLNVRSLITASGNVVLEVGGSILSGAVINAFGDIFGVIQGAVGGNFAARQNITFSINSGINGAQMVAGDGLEVGVLGAIRNALLNGDSGVTLTVSGSIFGSTLAAGDSDVSLAVSGSVTNSSFTGDGVSGTISGSATNSVFQGSESDISLTIGGTLTGGRVVSGSEDVTLVVSGDIVGTKISALESEVSLDVGGAIRNATITAATDITLDVGRSVIGSSVTAPSGEISFDIVGGVSNSKFIASSEVSGSITGSVTGSTFSSTSSDVSLEIGGSVTGSLLEAASNLSLDVGGSIVNSNLFADEGGNTISMVVTGDVRGTTVQAGSNDVTADVKGSVSGSKFFAPEESVSLTVGGSLSDTDIVAGSDVSLDVTGSITRLRASSTTSDITLTAGGSLTRSNLTSSVGEISADVGGSVIASVLAAATAITLSVTGDVRNFVTPAGANIPSVISASSAGADLTVDIGGSLVQSRVVGNDVNLKIGLDMFGFVHAFNLDVNVGRDVRSGARLQTRFVSDHDGDNIAFSIGRNFNGVLDVSNTFATGTGATQTLIGGVVGSGAVLNIADIDDTNSAAEFVFGGNFNGTLNINNALDVSLRFGGNVNQIIIAGAVVDDIIIAGRLTSLTSGSLFTAIDTNDGSFRDGFGITTATLDTGTGHGNVTPKAA